MIATFLALFFALAGCQALAAVKLADRLSPNSGAGRSAAEPARGRGAASPA